MANEILIGKGWGFQVGIDAVGGFRMSSNDAEIEEAIAIIIGTSPGERVMRPLFGCRIHDLVFAPDSAETFGLALSYVEEALGMGEPRIDVESVPISADPLDREGGRLNIEVQYTIRATKDSRSLVYPFYLIEHE